MCVCVCAPLRQSSAKSFSLNALRLLCSSAILSALACRGASACSFQFSGFWPGVEEEEEKQSELTQGRGEG